MMKSWHRYAFHIIGLLCWESTDHPWIPLTINSWVASNLRCLNTYVKSLWWSHETSWETYALVVHFMEMLTPIFFWNEMFGYWCHDTEGCLGIRFHLRQWFAMPSSISNFISCDNIWKNFLKWREIVGVFSECGPSNCTFWLTFWFKFISYKWKQIFAHCRGYQMETSGKVTYYQDIIYSGSKLHHTNGNKYVGTAGDIIWTYLEK